MKLLPLNKSGMAPAAIPSIFIALFFAGCATPAVQFTPASSYSMQVASEMQPVAIRVVDARSSHVVMKEVDQLPPPGSMQPVEGKKKAGQEDITDDLPALVGDSLRTILKNNKVAVAGSTDLKPASTMEVRIEILDALLHEGSWKARVKLHVTAGRRSQDIESVYDRYNFCGKRDAIKALDEVLSSSLNQVDFSTLLKKD